MQDTSESKDDYANRVITARNTVEYEMLMVYSDLKHTCSFFWCFIKLIQNHKTELMQLNCCIYKHHMAIEFPEEDELIDDMCSLIGDIDAFRLHVAIRHPLGGFQPRHFKNGIKVYKTYLMTPISRYFVGFPSNGSLMRSEKKTTHLMLSLLSSKMVRIGVKSKIQKLPVDLLRLIGPMLIKRVHIKEMFV